MDKLAWTGISLGSILIGYKASLYLYTLYKIKQQSTKQTTISFKEYAELKNKSKE